MKTTTLTTFTDQTKAHMMVDILKNEGIECMLQGEYTSQVLGYIPSIGIQLLVFEKDEERARQLLENSFPEESQQE